MNTASWPQEIVVKPMEEIITNTTTNADTTNNTNSNNKISNTTKPQPSTSLERKVRPQKEQALNCPRCNSTNTKFCYYNNYSLTQPRYFCKTCRRYWTEGGSLRSIPVGGGSRKNKRPASSAFPSSNTSKIKLPDLVTCTNPSPKIHQHSGQDLNLGFPSTLSEFMQMPNNTSSQLSALELLTGLSSSSRGLNLMSPFMGMTQIPHHHDPDSVFPSGFSLQSDLKPGGINFSLDGLGNGGGLHGVQESGGGVVNNGGRNLFPFEHLKSTNITSSATTTTTTTTTTADENHHQNQNSEQQVAIDQQGDSTGYWTGILGGAGSW